MILLRVVTSNAFSSDNFDFGFAVRQVMKIEYGLLFELENVNSNFKHPSLTTRGPVGQLNLRTEGKVGEGLDYVPRNVTTKEPLKSNYERKESRC